MQDGWGLIPKRFELYGAPPTARHLCDVSSKLSWPAIKSRLPHSLACFDVITRLYGLFPGGSSRQKRLKISETIRKGTVKLNTVDENIKFALSKTILM